LFVLTKSAKRVLIKAISCVEAFSADSIDSFVRYSECLASVIDGGDDDLETIFNRYPFNRKRILNCSFMIPKLHRANRFYFGFISNCQKEVACEYLACGVSLA